MTESIALFDTAHAARRWKMPRPNLLLCFDAFGTLFTPKRTVALQYSEIARQCGLTDIRDHDVQTSLHAAIKEELERNPNYGKAAGLGATTWWENVIRKTFTPLVGAGEALPAGLAPCLLRRFASIEGYDAEPTLHAALGMLRERGPAPARRLYGDIVVGVVTNSDDRVPGILASAGLRVSPLRYGSAGADEAAAAARAGDPHAYDIDFHCMSYDVGAAKPDARIFAAAEYMLARVLAARAASGNLDRAAGADDAATWRKVYVGDEYDKDVAGATGAGWSPILLDADNQAVDVPEIQRATAGPLDLVLQEQPVSRIRSLQALASWLTGSAA